MALIEKVTALREQIGVAAGGGSIPDDVQTIAKQLGLWAKVEGKPLIEQVDACYHVVFADAKPQPHVVVTGQPVTSVDKVVAVEPTPTPKPKPKPKPDLKLGSTPSHGSPPSNNALNTELNNVARNTNDTARARALVEAGADLSSTNGPHWRHTPLHQACYHGRYEMAKVLLELGADTSLHSNPCGRGKHGTPLELARGGNHKRIVELLLNQPATSAAASSSSSTVSSTTTAANSSSNPARAGLPASDKFAGERLWDKSLHSNGGPRGDQSLPCLTICCAAPFTLCPLHCLSAWGCDGAVGALTYAAATTALPPYLAAPAEPRSGLTPSPDSWREQVRAVLHERLLLSVLTQLEEPALVLRRAARLGVVIWTAAHRHGARREWRQAAHAQPRRRECLLGWALRPSPPLNHSPARPLSDSRTPPNPPKHRRGARETQARRRMARGVGAGGQAGGTDQLAHAPQQQCRGARCPRGQRIRRCQRRRQWRQARL